MRCISLADRNRCLVKSFETVVSKIGMLTCEKDNGESFRATLNSAHSFVSYTINE